MLSASYALKEPERWYHQLPMPVFDRLREMVPSFEVSTAAQVMETLKRLPERSLQDVIVGDASKGIPELISEVREAVRRWNTRKASKDLIQVRLMDDQPSLAKRKPSRSFVLIKYKDGPLQLEDEKLTVRDLLKRLSTRELILDDDSRSEIYAIVKQLKIHAPKLV